MSTPTARRNWIVPAVVLTILFLEVPAAQAAGPTITGFNPTSGPAGTSVQISGIGFQDGSVVLAVTFNGTAATFTVNSDVLITATVPAGATGGPIEVTDAEGIAMSASNFTVTPSLVPTMTSPEVVTQPSQPTGGPYRAFSPSSEWNKPLPAGAPIDPRSAQIIAELNSYANGGYPRLVTGAWSEPIYFTDASDRVGQVNCLPLQTRIPPTLAPAATSDAQATVFDLITGVVYKVRSFTIDWTTDPVTVNAAGGCSVYDLTSNGLQNSLPESDRDAPMNAGHRGYPPAIHAVRYDEVASGHIQHVLKVSLGGTAPCHTFPGAGNEQNNGGVLTCEGLILRIKPSVNLMARGLAGGPLVIARAMRRYGVVIGDTGGVAMALKTENLEVEGRTERWSTLGVTTHAFQGKLNFDDFEVIQAGYHRP